MTDNQWERFQEILLIHAKEKGGLTVVDIFMLKESFMSCEIERCTESTTIVTESDGSDVS